MNKDNGLQSSDVGTILDEIKKDGELIMVWGPILSVIFSFSLYVIRSLYFCHWGIDIFFYNEDNVIYKLIYFFGCACFLSFVFLFLDKVINSNKFNEREKNRKGLIGFLIYLIFTFLLSSNQLIERGFTIYNIILQFNCSAISFFVIAIQAKNNLFKKIITSVINYSKTKNNDIKIDIYNKFVNILSIIVPVFLSVIVVGIFEICFKKDYRIIETDQSNECSVVLYSTKDYFIVSECEIDDENDELFIYKNKVKKIDNEGVITNKRIFYKIREKK